MLFFCSFSSGYLACIYMNFIPYCDQLYPSYQLDIFNVTFQEFSDLWGEKSKTSTSYVSQLLLRSQKLSESRAEGEIAEPCTEGRLVAILVFLTKG